MKEHNRNKWRICHATIFLLEVHEIASPKCGDWRPGIGDTKPRWRPARGGLRGGAGATVRLGAAYAAPLAPRSALRRRPQMALECERGAVSARGSIVRG